MQKLKHDCLKFCKWLFGISGALGLIFFVLSFTDLPYYAYHYLGTCNAKLYYKPDVIVLLGGAGMPSPDGLIRSYYAAEAAGEFKKAEIVIALPFSEGDSLRQLNMMKRELIMRQVDSSRIRFEPYGFNTYSQAEQIAKMYAARKARLNVLLITSPEHMYRSVKTFSRMGFAHVGGNASFEDPIGEERVRDRDSRKDARIKNLTLRYNMWSYLNYELLVLKEYCAIAYYKIKGWI